jgi:excisionase family DNA binding protein
MGLAPSVRTMSGLDAHPPLARREPKPGPPPPRLALTKVEAAAALGVSVDFLEQHVMPELRVVRRGRRRLIPVRELERWLDKNAVRALDRG